VDVTPLLDSPARSDVAVVRQPIADERHGVIGYELVCGGERQSVVVRRPPHGRQRRAATTSRCIRIHRDAQ